MFDTSFRNEAPDPPMPGAPPPAELQKSAREEALEREVTELRQSNQTWMEMARRQPSPTPVQQERRQSAPVHDEEDDLDIFGEDEELKDDTPDETPEALVDAISKEGLSALKKRGFVREIDVQRMIRTEAKKISLQAARGVVQAERQKITTDSAIMREFPELADQNSDLFKLTSEIVRDTVKIDPKAAKSQGTLYASAKAAQNQLKATRHRGDDEPEASRRAARKADDDDDALDDRQSRVRAQAPPERTRSRSRIESQESDEVHMSEDAKQIAKMMNISDDDYKAEAKRIGLHKSNGGRR